MIFTETLTIKSPINGTETLGGHKQVETWRPVISVWLQSFVTETFFIRKFTDKRSITFTRLVPLC
jgi:hypothetical protein